MDVAIQKNQEIIDKIKKGKETIKNETDKQMKLIDKKLGGYEKDIENKNHVSLGIQQWKMQRFLKDIQKQMVDFSTTTDIKLNNI